MSRFLPFILAFAMISPAFGQAAEPVPEGIHSEGNGRADICDLLAATVAELEVQVAQRVDVEKLPGTPEYTAYAIGGLRVLTFTTELNRAHPAVACRQVTDNPNGGSSIQTSLTCHNSRENCDWLFREFEVLNKRTVQAMEGKQ